MKRTYKQNSIKTSPPEWQNAEPEPPLGQKCKKDATQIKEKDHNAGNKAYTRENESWNEIKWNKSTVNQGNSQAETIENARRNEIRKGAN